MQAPSQELGISELIEDSIAAWERCGTELPDLGRPYSRREQAECEQLADECLERVDAVMRQLRRRKLGPEEARNQVTGALVKLTHCALDLRDPYVDWLLGDGFGSVSTALARQARQMDSSVSMIDILQAARNAWTACGLQAMLGRSVELTPAIFAYSMLYPYSDNYLDDAALSPGLKLDFSERFRQRLQGEKLHPANAHESTIWALVGIIEGQYPRSLYPQVYESLLAIHAAQEQSISQLSLNGGHQQFDVLRLTFTKGGTSVLADACLAAGQLTREEARFAFHWGVLLQLGDDLQDLNTDARHGSLTLYTREAKRNPLDEVTSRTLNFGRSVMAGIDQLPESSPVLKQLLQKSAQLLLIRSAAGLKQLFTARYLRQLETYSPFGFDYLDHREQELARRQREYALLFEDLIRIRRNETHRRIRTFRLQNVLTRQ